VSPSPSEELLRVATACQEAGAEAWPGITIDRDRLTGYLDEKLTAAADGLNLAGLFLAHAVLERRPGAVERFCAQVLPAIDAPLRHLGADASRLDELRQMVLDAVIVGGARGPAIAGYAGRSDLRGWLRSVAVRVALKAWSRERPGEPLDEWEELGGVMVDPAILHLKAQYADDVAAAFRDAVAALTARERTLLRLHHLDGLTVDDLARMYSVHRATAARWVAAAREVVFEDTRVRLHARLGFDDAELVSIVRLVQSQLVQSLRRLLA
jgi:RNA polymerase sigma-70 factor (ECF subfamily)